MPGPLIFEKVERDREQIFPLLYRTLSCQYPQKKDQNQKCLDSYIRKNSDAPLGASELAPSGRGCRGGGGCRVFWSLNTYKLGVICTAIRCAWFAKFTIATGPWTNRPNSRAVERNGGPPPWPPCQPPLVLLLS